MSVIRVEKTRDYTVMSNFHLRDTRLSLKAKGILSQCLSFPPGWEFTLKGLAAINPEGIDSVRSGIEELAAAGYIKRGRVRDSAGRLRGTDYTVFEEAQSSEVDLLPVEAPTPDEPASGEPTLENPTLDNPSLEKPTQASPTQLSTYVSSTEILNIEALNTDELNTEENTHRKDPRHRYGTYGNVLLADKDVAKLKAQFPDDWEERIERIDEYVQSTGRRYSDYLATIRAWDRRNKKRGSTRTRPAPETGSELDYAVGAGDAL